MILRVLVLSSLALLTAIAKERPNIVWITSEDNSAHWLGCYGNKDAKTPHLDQLAAEGLRFTSCFSNAPVCAVARSTILRGVHAVSSGTQHMRSRHLIPSRYSSYVDSFREAGYYCTNNSKTDYNFAGNYHSMWDECGKAAHYKNRKDDQPFFAVFNIGSSHESALFEGNIKKRRAKGQIPSTPRVPAEDVLVPPYLPDLPAIRSDIAIYHDTMTLMDREVGSILQGLEEAGLAENTIVFYYADHGGILPRGKRYLRDTGVLVPLIVRIPTKWESISTHQAGTVVEEPVSFVDFAPTALSVAGLDAPEVMQGRAFLGSNREEPEEGELEFLFADRFDSYYGMRRGVTDGRWKYIRRFTPHLPAAPYSEYQFGQAGWRAWRAAWQEGLLEERFKSIWERGQEVELLFDTDADPWETTNLANHEAHQQRLRSMRKGLEKTMARYGDTGIIPEPMFDELAGSKPLADYVNKRRPDWADLVRLSFIATEGQEENLPVLLSEASSDDPLRRFWAARGLIQLGDGSVKVRESLDRLLDDSHAAIRVEAAYALSALGEGGLAIEALLAELDKPLSPYNQLYLLNAFSQLDAMDSIPDRWISKALKEHADGGKHDYVLRFAERERKARRPEPRK
ncbi:MAG: sulfatase-like hydrolase/transferase [Verrucomicrobiota bacterium JB023]|nr:sulfatase-like hydrolase/transferase [Verrucomicrobiota bacterium JB023]